MRDTGPKSRSEQRLWLLTSAFLVLGVMLRLIRYLQNFPLWGDEAFLAVHFLRGGYLELLQPLGFGQVAPPLFCWVVRLNITVLGFSESSLRLFPLVCSIASMFVFDRLHRGHAFAAS
jgi:hypothetical protein